jgi:hypothetical protein
MKTKYPIGLGTLFFGAYRRQVLGLLLLPTDESFHLRELAQLAESGVLIRERVRNPVHYKADTACPT